MKRLDKCLKIARGYRPRAFVMDIGCGNGEFSTKLNCVLHPREIVLLDRIIGKEITAQSIPYPDCSFDFIFAGNMLDILPNPDHLLTEIRRMLRFDGVALLTFPSLDWWANKIAILLGYQPYGDRPSRYYNVGKLFIKPQKFSEPNAGFIHLFSRRAFKQLAEFYGFKVKFHTLPWQRFSIVSLTI